MSTDGYTVTPLFFPGGNIGTLAVHGTVNDVSMLGARPRYLTCGFILEEGLDLDLLRKVVESMAEAARSAGVLIVSGDTKVVPRGACDKLFITTAGVGEILADPSPSGSGARPGDAILVRPWAITGLPCSGSATAFRSCKASRATAPRSTRWWNA